MLSGSTSPRLVIALATLVGLAGCGGEPTPEPTVAELTARPLDEPSVRQPEPLVRTPDPSPSPSPTVAPPPPSPTPTGPSEAQKARYAAAYAPAGSHGVQHVAIDLDHDGVDELLFTYVAQQRSRVDVAGWDGNAYEVVAGGVGGTAQRIERVRVGDVNADGRIEIVTFEAHESGASLTVFAVPAVDRLVGLRGIGGCYDGSATYGVVGAELRDTDGDGVPEIVARCDDSPLPVSAWSEETYRWDDGAYRVVADGPLPTGGDDDDQDDDQDGDEDGDGDQDGNGDGDDG